MTKAEYLAELEKRLGVLDAEERAELLADYEAHFEHGLASGRPDEEIVRRLGPPQAVAREILYQLSVDRASAQPTLRRVSRAVFAGVGLGLVNVLVLLVPFCAGLILVAAMFLVSVLLVASPVLAFVQDGPTAVFLLELPLLTGMVGAGLVIWVAAVRCSSLFVRWMVAWLQRNVRMIAGDRV